MCLTSRDCGRFDAQKGASRLQLRRASRDRLAGKEGKGKAGGKARPPRGMNGGCNLLRLGEHAEMWVTADVMFARGAGRRVHENAFRDHRARGAS